MLYDVIIIGAGPAGSLAAKKLAEAKLKVLVVDKKKLPRHKMCSGLISSFARRILNKEIGNFPSVLCCHPKIIKGMQVYPAKTQPAVKLWEKSYNVWRSDFDFWLTTKASEAGAEVLDQTELLNFREKDNHIEVELKDLFGPQKHQARFLIAADGGISLIRRQLYKNEPQKWFQVYQTYWRGTSDLDPEYFHSFLDPDFTEFFAWSNLKTGQKGKYLIIGTAAAKGRMVQDYFKVFQEYLEEAHGFRFEKLLFREACTAPAFFDPTAQFKYKLGKGNILLVGEAASLFNVFAEGISPALTSAVNASDAILQAEDHALEKYQENIQPLCQNLKIAWEGLFKMFPTLLSKYRSEKEPVADD